MRLIDADALYKSFGASGNCNNCPLGAYKCQYYNEHTLMEFCERIDDAPTVDAVEVVRCKDCKWYRNANDKYFPRTCDHWSEMFFYYEGWESVDENGFCSWAERREDETN